MQRCYLLILQSSVECRLRLELEGGNCSLDEWLELRMMLEHCE